MEVAVQPEVQVLPPVSGPASSWNAALKTWLPLLLLLLHSLLLSLPAGRTSIH